MADRTSAEIFGLIFDLLAEGMPADPKEAALRFWEMSQDYDFSPEQMESNLALAKFGLLRMAPPHPKRPEDGEHRVYMGDDEFDKARPLTEDEIAKFR